MAIPVALPGPSPSPPAPSTAHGCAVLAPKHPHRHVRGDPDVAAPLDGQKGKLVALVEKGHLDAAAAVEGALVGRKVVVRGQRHVVEKALGRVQALPCVRLDRGGFVSYRSASGTTIKTLLTSSWASLRRAGFAIMSAIILSWAARSL